MTRLKIAASSLAILASAPVLAQEQQQEQDQGGVEVLSQWSYEPLYREGWSVENMFDVTEVAGENGEVIGDVENVIFSNDGEVLAIIAQVGGFWDIGDTHVSVPWEDVTVAEGIDRITVPVTEENVDDFDVFGDFWDGEEVITGSDTETTQAVDDDLAAGAEVFKATDLLGDYVFLSNGVRYGYVSDLLVQDGRISAIVSDAAAFGTRGYYAYPYTYRRDMTMGPRYDMPYDATQIGTLENFDYEELQSRVEG